MAKYTGTKTDEPATILTPDLKPGDKIVVPYRGDNWVAIVVEVKNDRVYFRWDNWNPREIESRPLEKEAEKVSFSVSIENDLRKFLLNNLGQIEPNLKLFENGEGFTTKVGRIDILATDKNENFVVIELKAGIANDSAIGQLLGYMGCISNSIVKGKEVRGYIIANDFDERLKCAIKSINNVKLKAYNINFSFEDVE